MTITKQLAAYPVTDVSKVGSRYMVQFGSMSESDYTNLAKLVNTQFKDADISYMGPVYSQVFCHRRFDTYRYPLY